MTQQKNAKPPTLATERLVLRRLHDTDAQAIFALRSDNQVNQYLDRQPSQTLEEAMSFIQKVLSNESYYWAITKADSGTLMGTVCLFDFSETPEKCEIGYELLPLYQGQGIMQEACKSVLAFASQTLGMRTIEAFTHKNNEGSCKLLEKFKFQKTGTLNPFNGHLIGYSLSF